MFGLVTSYGMSPVKKNQTSALHPLSDGALLTALIAFIFLSLLAFAGSKQMSTHLATNTTTATMIFSFNDSKDRIFSGQVTDKMTVLEALLASAQGANLAVSYKLDGKNNVTLSTIGKDSNSKDHEWMFYLNNELIKTIDINKIFVKSGDIIKAKYQ